MLNTSLISVGFFATINGAVFVNDVYVLKDLDECISYETNKVECQSLIVLD